MDGWTLNNTGLIFEGPLIRGFFFPLNLFSTTMSKVESVDMEQWIQRVIVMFCVDLQVHGRWVPLGLVLFKVSCTWHLLLKVEKVKSLPVSQSHRFSPWRECYYLEYLFPDNSMHTHLCIQILPFSTQCMTVLHVLSCPSHPQPLFFHLANTSWLVSGLTCCFMDGL